MNATDLIGIGLTAFACGVGGAVQNWPSLPSMLIGCGLGLLLIGVRRARVQG